MEIDSGDTAWILASTALVLFMTPGLALFYGGMVRAKNMLSMLMQNVFAMGLMAVLWVLLGYSIAFGGASDWIGNLDHVAFKDVGMGVMEGLTIPVILFAAFQMTFAIITPALITGATADRLKFGAYAVFIAVWLLVVYSPVAHWVWGGGWIFDMGALDFAGGAVVHINAGAAALALAIMLGKRKGWPREGMHPHNLPLTVLGTGILWFGWAGFNAGSALAANGLAAQAIMNTFIAASSAMLTWVLVEWIRDGKPTTLGAASGAVAGLVAITPCAGFVATGPAMVIGGIAGVLCLLAIGLKTRFGYDDALDVVGVHLVGGLVGALLLGLFADTAINEAGADGLFLGGGFELLGKQAIASFAVLAFSFVVTMIIGKAIDATIGLRVDDEAEDMGLDLAEHAETAYSFSDMASMDRLGGHGAAHESSTRQLEDAR
jgi:Amt family ammonium transporter